MKNLFSAIALVFAFSTGYGQTCGNLTVTNNSPNNISFNWGVGDAACTQFFIGSSGVAAGGGITTIAAPAPTMFDWLGISVTSAPGGNYPAPFPGPNCGTPFGSLPVTWTGNCTVTIN